MNSQSEYLLSMEGINKSFYGVQVLKDVKFYLKRGEILGFVGENGAGKSTLMKILNGVYTKDSGKIILEGKEVNFKGPLDALDHGISFIHQELSLVPDMSVMDNIYLGSEIKKPPFNFLSKKKMEESVEKILADLELDITPNQLVGELDIAKQQMVEIARALFYGAKIVVMDEPTSSIADKEVDILFRQMRRLKEQGTSIIFITHRMYELPMITDTITVLRDGQWIGMEPTASLTPDDIVTMMVGRKIESERMLGEISERKEVVLEVKNLHSDYVKDVSFKLYKGEVLGFAGLVGAGRTEVMKAIFGIDTIKHGEILIDGRSVKISKPKDAIKYGIGLVPEDRKKQGLIISHTVARNLTLLVLDQFFKFIRYDGAKENEIISEYSKKLNIKMSGPEQFAYNLSGGNQQKIVLSKWLAEKPRILILDEPTRGIDVGAKTEIYELIRNLAKQGMSIIVISSELPEVIKLSQRIAVMSDGKLVKIIDDPYDKNEDELQKIIMHYSTGGGYEE